MVNAYNDYGETVLHHISGIKWNPLIFKDYLNLVSLGWSLEIKDVCGNTPIDLAIDYRNWTALGIFIKGNLSHSCVVHAIGELLAQYWHIGSIVHDQFIFSLINKAKMLNKDEGEYLLVRACNGAAWPYLIPLLLVTHSSLDSLRMNFPWQILENKRLSNQIVSKIENYMDHSKDSILRAYKQHFQMESPIIGYKHAFYKMPFITRHRKCISRGLKKQLMMDNININFISVLLNMFCSIK